MMLFGGEVGFVMVVVENVLGIEGLVDWEEDFFMSVLWEGSEGVEVVKGNGRMMSGLVIELMIRDRVKFVGKMLVGVKGNGGKV